MLRARFVAWLASAFYTKLKVGSSSRFRNIFVFSMKTKLEIQSTMFQDRQLQKFIKTNHFSESEDNNNLFSKFEFIDYTLELKDLHRIGKTVQ